MMRRPAPTHRGPDATGQLRKSTASAATEGSAPLWNSGLVALQRTAAVSPAVLRLDALQRLADSAPKPAPAAQAVLGSATPGGLPARLRTGIEALSGVSLEGTRVHRNSPAPARIGALAFAQGRDIHLGPGQDRHLPHEAWHVVQQVQGRVHPTLQAKGIAINDDLALEAEADRMGDAAVAAADRLVGARTDPSLQSPGTLADRPYQRKISYARGGYPNRKALLAALCSLFPADQAAAINARVKENEAVSWSVYASSVYRDVIDHMIALGHEPNFGAVTSPSSSNHGPMLPDRVSRTAPPNPESALSTFNFSSVTLGRLTVMSSDGKISFHDRQADADFHAEDGLMDQLKAFMKRNRIPGPKTAINLTINNFFCDKSSTGKSLASDNCLDEIIALQRKYKFARFHVYFQNTYGKVSEMDAKICRLQAAGIRVSSFTTREMAPFTSNVLDSASESDEEGDASPRRGKAGRHGKAPQRTPSTKRGRDAFEPDSDDNEQAAESSPRDRKDRGRRKRPASAEFRDDRAMAADRTYLPTHPRVRDGGQCLWDTLRHYGVSDDALARAAGAAGLTLDQHVYNNQIWPLLGELSRITGATYRLNIDYFDVASPNLAHYHTVSRGHGATTINIGFFVHRDTGQGHYVPPI